MRRTNTILAAAFLVVLFTMAGYTFKDYTNIYTNILDAWQKSQPENTHLLAKVEFAADRAESALNTALDRDHYFIEFYGAVQKYTGQRLIEDAYSNSVVRMDNGALTFGSVGQTPVDVSHNAVSTANFAAALAEQEIPFTAVITPCKNPRGVEILPAPLRNYNNEQADQFLGILEAENIHTVDLRDGMGSDLTDYFYHTDHHWNIDGAFLGNQLLTAELSGQYGFTPFAPGLDASQFTQTVYEDYFLGSQGKRVGTNYAGVDDFITWHPTFDTNISYQTSDTAQPRTGTMDQAMYFDWYMGDDYFKSNPYGCLSGGDLGKATAVNHLNPDGPTVVMIRDSFACALTPFFALQCGKLVTIDLRAYEGSDLMAEIKGIDPDLVMIFYNPGTVSSDNMFVFPGV